MIRNPSVIANLVVYSIVMFAAAGQASPSHTRKLQPPPVSTLTNVAVADLEDIRDRAEFRVLIPSASFEVGFSAVWKSSHRHEVKLIEEFAERQRLRPVWIPIDEWSNLIPSLLSTKGDLIAANMTVTPTRKEKVAFTVPVHTVREQLIVRAGDDIKTPDDLVGREVAVRENSSFWTLLKHLRTTRPGIEVKLLPEQAEMSEITAQVKRGDYDIAAVDVPKLELTSVDWTGLRVVDGFLEDDAIAWGVNPKAPQLLKALNTFLAAEQLKRRPESVYKTDLAGIKKRKTLRVLTRNNAATFYIWRGELYGFEYELLREFAKSEGLELEMIVAPSRQHLIPSLLWGGGDLIAASLSITEQRKKYGVTFSDPYNAVHEVVVSRADEDYIKSAQDLVGRTVVVRRSSSYWTALTELRESSGVDFEIKAAPEDIETEEIIARVATGEYDLTVAGDDIVDVELTWRNDIRTAFQIKGPVDHGWAVRAENTELLAALNKFIKKRYRKKFYNIVHHKYFDNPRRARRHALTRADRPEGGHLSPYDDLVRKYAKRYGMDWQMIISLMYQESRFNPKAQSWAGAQGLLQLLPVTAKRFGVRDLNNPEQGIRGGVRYLAWLQDQFDPELAVKDRMWFSLAAYNAGLGHVKDARRLARKLGLDPNQWFGHVEKTMLLLSRKEYYRHSRHGYVRGREPVAYVRAIRERYNAYVSLVRAS